MRPLWVVSPWFSLVLLLYAYANLYDAPPKTKTFLGRRGDVIGTLDPAYDGLQIWTRLEEIPLDIIGKTIGTEDRFFYRHHGINPVSLLRAAFQNLTQGRVVRGGSTITQQLARNLIQAAEGKTVRRSLWNKGRETVLALGLELKHSKSWILERYLNSVYYGRRCYGIAAAARTYFGKLLWGLSSAEIDFLVARPKAPNRFARTGEAGCSLESGEIPLSPDCPHLFTVSKPVGRHFMEYLAKRGAVGTVIETTLDLDLQERLESVVRDSLAERVDPLLTAAAVVIDVSSGDLLAMIGSRDYFNESIQGQVNAAVARRQPGSTLKPFTYFAAFAKGYHPSTLVSDEPVSFPGGGAEEAEGYAPQNFDRRYHGDMTIRQALANSYNIPAVITLNEIGLSYYHDVLRKFGLTTLTRPPPYYGLSVTLGSGEVTLLELTNAYAALARGGRYLPYWFLGQSGQFEGRVALGPDRMITPNAAQFAAQVTDILSDPDARLKAFGFNDDLVVEGHPVAVKTGTSYAHRDNWTIGYTPSFAVGVWVGHADGSSLDGTTGASGAAPLWHAIMENLLRGTEPEAFPPPPQVRLPPVRLAAPSTHPSGWEVVSPVANGRYRTSPLVPLDHQKIAAEVRVTGDQIAFFRWYLNGRFLAETPVSHRGEKIRVWISPEPGSHLLRVESADGQGQKIPFRVMEASL